jgi:cobalt-zinc-cadmium efflux system protein
MLWIATGGLFVNLAGLWVLGPGRSDNLNVRGAWLHVMSDALGSVGAIVAGALIWAFGWTWADAVASLAIAGLIVFSAWHLLRDAVDVLMEAAPRHLDPDQIEQALADLTGVAQVHDLHVWTIGNGGVSLSCHLVAETDPHGPELLSDAYLMLGERFGIAHATIQIEPKSLAGETPTSLCAGGCPPDL